MASSADKQAMDVDFPSEEDYEHLIEDYSHLAPPSEGELLQGHVVKVTPQEIIVDFGYKLEGLVPIEQVRQPDATVPFKAGDPIDVMIDRSSAQPEGYVLLSFSKASRLRIWDNLERAMREQLLVSGLVTERTKGGLMVDVGVPAFMPGSQVDLRPIDGLLHVSDMSHGRVNHPSEVVHVGDEITVKILKFDREKERISLGIRQLTPDPWETLPQRCPAGSRIVGRVMSVTDYGAFVEIEPGVEGLIHISEMTWSRRMKHPSKVVKAGDQVEAVVLEVKVRDRRVSLGIKQLEADPWTTVGDRYSIGSVVEGRVRKLTDFGAFLEIEDGVDGLVHVSDLSWTKHVKHPSEMLKKGQMMQAVILSIDAPNRRLSLGVKQLQPDAWEGFFRSHEVGDLVRGRVCRAAAFGMFVELAPGVEALCHKSEIPPMPDKAGAGDSTLPIGDEYDFKIIKMNET